MTEKFVCIHGHFYQPPRENPWLEEVEFQESAHPYHDWNTRITAECYAPNSASRIMDPQWRIIGLVNNYSKISFNFGPTLLYWLSRHEPNVYQSVLEADKESSKSHSGHGCAIAQIYNHMIMPLANRKDKETQVKWGVRDFETRFGRYPEGMWLPETAVDLETLEVLAESNIKFTILAPHQAARIRKVGETDWIDVSGEKVDPRRPYVCRLPSGKTISLFFINKFMTTEMSFGNLLANGEGFAKKTIEAFKESDDAVALVNLATDGELYGHHHPHGDMTLAYCLYLIASNNLASITNYAEYLEKHPAEFEVEIQQNTSWSCPHGIERWRSDCGCNTGKTAWRQGWRKPLRKAMDWLRDELVPRFESAAREYLIEPWQARNDYIDIVNDRSKDNVETFLKVHAIKPLDENQKRQVVKLLEMQRQAMLMYTSCGWFFDEISGIETVQVMMYAARAIQLAHEILGLELENQFVNILTEAPSNVVKFENGARIYAALVRPEIVDLTRIGAQHAMLSLFSDQKSHSESLLHQDSCCFSISDERLEKREAGKFRLVVGRSRVSSFITLDQDVVSYAAIWLGDHNVYCGVMRDMKDADFEYMLKEVTSGFEKGQINETILLIPKHFGKKGYSLKDMFKDDQQQILNYILQTSVKNAIDLYEIVYKDNSAMIRFMNEIRIAPPRTLRTASDIILNGKILDMLSSEDSDAESFAQLISDSKSLSIEFDLELISLQASVKVANELAKLVNTPDDLKRLENLERFIRVLRELPIQMNLWLSQNIAFKMGEKMYKTMREKGDDNSRSWLATFDRLCESLGIRFA